MKMRNKAKNRNGYMDSFTGVLDESVKREDPSTTTESRRLEENIACYSVDPSEYDNARRGWEAADAQVPGVKVANVQPGNPLRFYLSGSGQDIQAYASIVSRFAPIQPVGEQGSGGKVKVTGEIIVTDDRLLARGKVPMKFVKDFIGLYAEYVDPRSCKATRWNSGGGALEFTFTTSEQAASRLFDLIKASRSGAYPFSLRVGRREVLATRFSFRDGSGEHTVAGSNPFAESKQREAKLREARITIDVEGLITGDNYVVSRDKNTGEVIACAGPVPEREVRSMTLADARGWLLNAEPEDAEWWEQQDDLGKVKPLSIKHIDVIDETKEPWAPSAKVLASLNRLRSGFQADIDEKKEFEPANMKEYLTDMIESALAKKAGPEWKGLKVVISPGEFSYDTNAGTDGNGGAFGDVDISASFDVFGPDNNTLVASGSLGATGMAYADGGDKAMTYTLTSAVISIEKIGDEANFERRVI
jgi:hypothetical protein